MRTRLWCLRVKMFEYLSEGSVMHTKYTYTIQKGKRVQVHADCPINSAEQSVFCFEVFAHTPLMLVPLTWKRYSFTKQDVYTTFGLVDACYVWLLCLIMLIGDAYDVESCTSGIRSTFQGISTFLFVSRKNMIEQLINQYSEFITPHGDGKSVLCSDCNEHRPYLPRVLVDAETHANIRTNIPVRQASFCHVARYKIIINFKDVLLVPVSLTGNKVCCHRVIAYETYADKRVEHRQCFLTAPAFVVFQEKKYVLSEEACFICEDTTSHTVNPHVRVSLDMNLVREPVDLSILKKKRKLRRISDNSNATRPRKKQGCE